MEKKYIFFSVPLLDNVKKYIQFSVYQCLLMRISYQFFCKGEQKMSKYKVYYEGFRVVEADTAEEAEFNEDNYLYGEREITKVEEMDPDEMYMDV